MDYIIGEDRNQFQIIVLDQLVLQDSWARVIDLFVESLPMDQFDFKNTKLNEDGVANLAETQS